MKVDRRKFVQLMSGSALAASVSSIQRALAIPAHNRTGTIEDVEHIVILMQENRSFDHYFGTLGGVRGFDDPRAVKLPSGAPVWHQPADGGFVSPFHPDAANLGLQFLEDLPHNWADTQAACNKGKYDRWVPNKGTSTMAYFTRQDIPYHYALADAFTVCDAYHCSFLGATDPNRYHMWTGWLGNDGQGGGPVLNNAELGYDWATFPERLQQAGVSWKIYQDAGAGLDAEHFWGWGDDAFIGNYGDNSLLYFHQYQNAAPGSPLFTGARTATDVSHQGGNLVDQFKADVAGGKLPQVSWIVAPEAFSEHGNWPTNFGAWYISQFLDALTAHPEVWSKTALFLTYDENDGFFDHMVPPMPPESPAQGWSTVDTTHELFPGDAHFVAGPLGLGVRVPMLVISPWSRGGWVSSEVFDHTSLIRFIEERFRRQHPDLHESNITRWRRAVAGDLTSAFDFQSPNTRQFSLPPTTGYLPADHLRHDDYVPVPTNPPQPQQEQGNRPARAVPYQLEAVAKVGAGAVTIHFSNAGKTAAVFQVRSGGGQDGPWTFTVGAGEQGTQSWPVAGPYDLSVYGPNGFFRAFRGTTGGQHPANLTVKAAFEPDRAGLRLEIVNDGGALSQVRITSAYCDEEVSQSLPAGRGFTHRFGLADSFGWYDLTIAVESDPSFAQRLAGHLESGCDSMTDPQIGAHARRKG
jgi:phospholipase C